MNDKPETRETLAEDVAEESTGRQAKQYGLGDLDDAFSLFEDEDEDEDEYGVEQTQVSSAIIKDSASVEPDARVHSMKHASNAGAGALWEEEKTEVLIGDEQDLVPEASLVDQNGRAYQVYHFPFVVGRSADCDLVLSGKGISRHHAQIEFSDNQYQIRDLKSLNGLKVNGRQVSHQVLVNSDEISVGNVTLRFQLKGSVNREAASFKGSRSPVSSLLDHSGQEAFVDRALAGISNASPGSGGMGSGSSDSMGFLLKLNIVLIALVFVFGGVYMVVGLNENRPGSLSLAPNAAASNAVAPNEALSQLTSQGSSGAQLAMQPNVPPVPMPGFIDETSPAVVSRVSTSTNAINNEQSGGNASDSGADAAVDPGALRAAAAVQPQREPFSVGSAERLDVDPGRGQTDQPEPIVNNDPSAEWVSAAQAQQQAQRAQRAQREEQARLDAQAALTRKQVEASALLASIEDVYLKSDALRTNLRLLDQYSRDADLDADLRNQLRESYERFQQLFSVYEEGLVAYLRDDEATAFEIWARFLRRERVALGAVRESGFASDVKSKVVASLKREAQVSESNGRYHQAYEKWRKAVSLNGDAQAGRQVREIDAEAQRLYQEGLAMEASEPQKAMMLWRKVVSLVPVGHDYHTRASAKLTWMKEWGDV